MKLTFEQTFHLLSDCSAVIWNDYFLTFPVLNDNEKGESEGDQFLELESEDENGQVFQAYFLKEHNQEVKAEGSSLFLKDSNGEEVQVTLLAPMTLPEDRTKCRKCGSPLDADGSCTDETCPCSDKE